MNTDTQQPDAETNILDSLNELAAGNRSIRNELITKLRDVVATTKFNPEEIRASELESRLGMISTIDSLMKSQEAVETNRLKLALQQKKDDDESDVSQMALELLKQIAPGAIPKRDENDDAPNLEDADAAIEERIKAEGIDVSEGELEEVSVVQ